MNNSVDAKNLGQAVENTLPARDSKSLNQVKAKSSSSLRMESQAKA